MFRPKRKTADLDAEIQSHLQLEIDRLREQGLSEKEARNAARRAFGNLTQAQERFFESRRWLAWDYFWQDVRYGARMLSKSPSFTAVALLTIALGVGASTAIFSVVDATLLHPLPFPHSEQLVSIVDDLRGVGAHDVGMSEPELRDLQRSGIFEYVSPAWFDENNLTGSSEPARVRLASVLPNYFALLGTKPQLGRVFDPKDPTPGYNLEVVISDGLWERAFGRDPQILRRSIWLDTDLYRIVGVMPAGFRPPGPTPEEREIEVWAALGFAGAPFNGMGHRDIHFSGTIGRLSSGLTLAAAQSRVDALVAALQKQFPVDYPARSAWTVRLVPLQESVVGNMRQSLILLLGAVGLVLLIGCVNVANLLLARASARAREMAIRQALGAARARIARQLLTESLLLSLLGGVAGLAVLYGLKGFLLRLVPDSLPRLNEISINWTVLLFALAASLLAGVIFGLAPALQAGRLDLNHMLKQEGRASTGAGEQARMRRVLVVTEFALSLVLMVAAGLLLRSFWDLLNAPLGFNPESVMAIRTRLPYPNIAQNEMYGTPALKARFVREVLRRAKTLPDIKEAALGDSWSIPLDHTLRDLNLIPLAIEGRELETNQLGVVEHSSVTPEYFHLLGIPLERGRLFTAFDHENAPPVAVVNEAFARTYWPNEDAVGKRLRAGKASAPWTTVVGVVANARTNSLAEANVPQLYLNLYQVASKHLAVFMRGCLDTMLLPGKLREQVKAVDPTLPVYGPQTLSDTVTESLSVRRFSMEIVGMFALTALLLAALGIYGVISYTIGQRTHEIGIRRALGAQSASILRMVVRQGLGLAIAGAAVGFVCALVVARLMAGVLYGVHPADPLTFAGVAALLIFVALLACCFPARRALRVDPVVALRHD